MPGEIKDARPTKQLIAVYVQIDLRMYGKITKATRDLAQELGVVLPEKG